MYPVSNDYIAKLKDIGSEKQRHITGRVDSLNFEHNDLLENSFEYSEECVKSADIKLGGVFIGRMSMTFLKGFGNIPRGTWKGRTIYADIVTLVDEDNGIWESVPLKPYVIAEANHTALGVDIVAYDYMTKFDLPIAMNTTSGTMYGLLVTACNYCSVELGMTAEEVQALPNGDQILGLYPDNDIETWRDLISWIAVTAGGFATIDRQGRLVIRTWSDAPVLDIGVDDRFEGGNWSDFSTNYSAITVSNIEAGTQSYYAVAEDNGMTMDIGANPLLQYGTNEVVETMRRNVLNAIQKLKYVPFTSSSLLDPAFDLGDVISYPNGIANNSICCVMRIDFSFQKGATLKGYGKNPAMSGARSAQDKAIAQAASQNKAQGLTYYTYLSTQAVSLTETPQRLYRIAFATAEETTVELWHEVKWHTEASGSDPVEITYEYYLDGVKFDYEPVDTWADGYHSMPHPYWLQDVSGGEVHYWEVRASVTGGTATADIGDVHALLKGQKLAAQVSFDGNIEITDEFEPFIAGFDIVALSDSISLDTQTPQTISLSDSVTAFVAGFDIVGLADNVRLRTAYVQFNIVSEDDDFNIVSEDGQFNIVSEGGYE